MPSSLYKLLVVGDYAVGKTCLIRKYTAGEFTSNYKITIGVDFCVKNLTRNGNQLILQLWDIAGHERFGSMTRVYYKFAVGAIVVFDISRPSTLDNVKKWKDDIQSKVSLPHGTPIPVLLLANKSDIPEIKIDKEKMDNFVKENGFIGWFLSSSKDNINVDEAFDFLMNFVTNSMAIDDTLVAASTANNNADGNTTDGGSNHDQQDNNNGLIDIYKNQRSTDDNLKNGAYSTTRTSNNRCSGYCGSS